MPEIDVKLSQITPSPSDTSSGTQVVGVQGGTTDNLFNLQQINNGPFFSTISTGVSGAVTRSSAGRFSDVVNVKDFGALGNGGHDDTAAIQAAVNALTSTGTLTGQSGRLYFPPGFYMVSPPVPGGPCITLPNNSGSTQRPTIIIEGAGSTQGGILTLGLGCNGFIFDDQATTTTGSGAFPWVIRDLAIRNTYLPKAIYKSSLVASGTWAYGAGTVTLTNASIAAAGGFDAGGGQILFENTTFAVGQVPGYLGFVASGGVAVGATTTVLTLGDGIAPSVGLVGAQVPSSAGATDTVTAVQGYFANGTPSGAWTGTASSATPTVITMAASNPSQVNGGAGLDVGQYYVWDWTTVTAGLTSVPQCIGVVTITGTPSVPTGGWVGNSLTLTMQAQRASVGQADLLVLSPISGAIRHTSTRGSSISDCNITGLIGVTFYASMVASVTSSGAGQAWLSTVKNCIVTCNGPAGGNGSASVAIGGMGVVLSQSGICINVDINGAWTGIRITGVSCTVFGGRQEICCYGIVVGGIGHNVGDNNNASQLSIFSTEQEGTWGAGVIGDTSALSGMISGLQMVQTHANSCYGIFSNGGNNLTVMNCVITGGGTGANAFGACWNPSLKGSGTPAAFYISDAGGSVNPFFATYISCTAECGQGTNQNGFLSTAWRMPTLSLRLAKFINCNQPPLALPFSKLPVAQTVTGSIAGQLMSLTAGTFTYKAIVGSAVNGAGVTAGTFITSNGPQGAAAGTVTVVNKSQTVGSTTLTVYPMIDGDEYLISDSQVPYRTLGASNVGTPINSGNTGGGGGIYHVKVRWDASQLVWVLV